MPEIMRNWLGTRVGVLLETAPHVFGRNTKDGTILAKLLYSYGVIPLHVLHQVKESKNFYDCHANWLVLKPWLEHIGVMRDNSTLKEIAGGEGSYSIALFYEVYLNLENKDRFFYISAQKERKFSDANCKRKFDIQWVPEASLKTPCGDLSLKLSYPLIEKREIIDWHKQKCQEVVKIIKETKEKFLKKVGKEHQKPAPVFSKALPLPEKNLTEEEEAIKILDSFEKKHQQKYPNLTYSELIKQKNLFKVQPCLAIPNIEEARHIINNIKRKKKSEVYARNFQEQMQNMVLDEQLKSIVFKQDNEFDNKVCENLIKQSQYEKQMATKLYQLRRQKKCFIENRNLIENLKMRLKEDELGSELLCKMEMKNKFMEEEERSKEKISELHRRMYGEKLRERRYLIRVEVHNIIQSIIDISLRISEIRDLTSCQIPKSLMKDLKELFFKNLPIFDILENFEVLCEDNENEDEEFDGENDFAIENDDLKNQEKHRQNVLNECDFVDYLHLVGSWMVSLLFPDGTENEVQQKVLGYIVHRLLELKYPTPNIPTPVPLKPMKPVVIIQGLDSDGYNMLFDLMEACKILIVRIDDVINFVLSVYKEELSVVRDIDIDSVFKKATEKSLQEKPKTVKEKEVSKKVQLLKNTAVEIPMFNIEFLSQDKQTQTPRKIPDDDPVFSPVAEIGKIAFEALGVGDPVPDETIISAVVAYVSSKQNNYEGWILLNYPQIYIQASNLEYALTGYRLLPVTDEVESIEDVEGFRFRTSCVDPFNHENNEQSRTSRLVPKPNTEAPLPLLPKTYFDSYIKMKKVNETSKALPEDPYLLSPVEKFYYEQNSLCIYEYVTLNFQAVKNLGKTILNGKMKVNNSHVNVTPKTSVEVFGNIIIELNEKYESKKKNEKKNEKASAGGPKNVSIKDDAHGNVAKAKAPELEVAINFEAQKNTKKSIDADPPPKPGDQNWEWASGPQPENLLLALASLWENMEAVYIDDFKDVFFCLRTHRNIVLSYCAFIKKSIIEIISQPDEKQKILGDFQQIFNDIDEDLRPDVEMKCEMYVRVAELQEALMTIADERKSNFLNEVTKVTQDGWAADQMAILVNHFLTGVQLEADRSVGTCQIIMDYYVSMQQRVPEEKALGKIILPKLQIKDKKYSIISSPSNKSSSSFTPKTNDLKKNNRSVIDSGTRATHERSSKTRNLSDKRKKSSEMSFLTGASEVIMEILKNLTMPEEGETPFHHFFVESVHTAVGEINSILELCLHEAKKTDKGAPKNTKKGSDNKDASYNANLNAEWETALENELSRINFRMKLILARGVYEMNEFLATVLNSISAMTEYINDIYLKEVNSISQCCKVFRCCIEEEIPIQVQLELKEDEFFVNENVLLFPNPSTSTFTDTEKEQSFRFTIEQLFLLFNKLQRFAPSGEIIKRALLYILEDVKASNPEFKNNNCFPNVWRTLAPQDLALVLIDVFQDLEIVHWKDFFIYAMDVPLPSEEELLITRNEFRSYDTGVTELISRENYDKIGFWFEASLDHYSTADRYEKAKDLLFKMYQVDENQTNYSALLLAFCKDHDPVLGFMKALALVMGKQIDLSSDGSDIWYVGEEEAEDFNYFDDNSTRPTQKTECVVSNASNCSRNCIPKEKIKKCLCVNTPISTNSTGSEEMSVYEGDAGEVSLFYDYPQQKPGNTTNVVPFNILCSLLKASFPSLIQLSGLLHCKQTFQDTLNSIYDSLGCKDDHIKVYSLLQHDFIARLIYSTNKFKYIDLKNTVFNIIKSKKSGMSSCFGEMYINISNACLD